MNKQRFNGLGFVLDLGVSALKVQKFSLDITDNSAVAKRNGRPDGNLRGDVEASGTITVDRDGLRAFVELAKSAGSWQEMDPFDINAFGSAGDDTVKVEAFGCRVKVNKLLDIDKNSSDETVFELPFDVTSPDFVKIDGVPYCPAIEE
jgi:hypothetical protein